jgi:hypothetical protein
VGFGSDSESGGMRGREGYGFKVFVLLKELKLVM